MRGSPGLCTQCASAGILTTASCSTHTIERLSLSCLHSQPHTTCCSRPAHLEASACISHITCTSSRSGYCVWVLVVVMDAYHVIFHDGSRQIVERGCVWTVWSPAGSLAGTPWCPDCAASIPVIRLVSKSVTAASVLSCMAYTINVHSDCPQQVQAACTVRPCSSVSCAMHAHTHSFLTACRNVQQTLQLLMCCCTQ